MENRNFVIHINTLKYIALFFVWIPAYSIYNWIPMANRVMLGLRLLCSTIIILKYFTPKLRVEYLLIGAYAFIEIISTYLYNRTNLFNA